MSKTFLTVNDGVLEFIEQHNAIINSVGDLSLLTTTQDSDIVGAINELEALIGSISPDSDINTIVDSLSSRIDSNASDINTLNANVDSNASDINTINSRLDSDTTVINSNVSRISTLESYLFDSANALVNYTGNFATGTILTTKKENYIYEVTDSSDYHISTAGGDNLYSRPIPGGMLDINSMVGLADSDKFAKLKTTYNGLDYTINLKGSVRNVSSIPTGLKIVNGGFKIADVLGDSNNVDVIYPAKETLDYDVTKISPGIDRYEAWPQDKLFVADLDGNETMFCGYLGGYAHGYDLRAKVAMSTDKGSTWQLDEDIYIPESDESIQCYAMGEIGGQLLSLVKFDVYPNGAHVDTKLYGKRLYERRKGDELSVTTTSGSNEVSFNSGDPVNWGVKPGDVVSIRNYDSDANGLNFYTNGDYTVTNVTSTTVVANHASNATSSGTVVMNSTSGVIEFNPDNTQATEMLFASGTQSFNEAVLAAGGSPFSSNPILYHDMVTWPGSGGGNFKTCCHGGGGGGPYAIQATGILRGTRAITDIANIGGQTDGGEPTIYRTSAGKWYGGIRGDETPAKLWYADSDGGIATATVTNFTDLFGRNSPVSVEVDETNDIVYIAMTDTRWRDRTAGPVPLLVGWCTTAEFEASGTSAFTFWDVFKLHFSHTNNNDGANAVGVQSATIYNDTLYIAFSTEHSPIWFDQDGQPRVYILALGIGPNGPIGQKLPKRNLRTSTDVSAINLQAIRISNYEPRPAFNSVTIAAADGTNWDPLSRGSGPYLVMHNGTSWIAIS